MIRKIISTADGSKTIQIPEWNEQYHSIHGAVAEAQHVFIDSAYYYYCTNYPDLKTINILEIGYGTGLNAIMTLIQSVKSANNVLYTGIEAFPVSSVELNELGYEKLFPQHKDLISAVHSQSWNLETTIAPTFTLLKRQQNFHEIENSAEFEIIYFDAFGPRVQPELWGEEIFSQMINALKPGGILTTYCSKGEVRRTMLKVGFKVEKLPGPPGKREMLRASKPC